MGSRAVVVVCRDADGRRAALRHRRTRPRHHLHPHRPSVLPRRRLRGRAPRRGCAPRSTTAGALGRARDRLGAARLRAPAVVGEGRGAAPRAVRVGRCGGRPQPRRRGGGARGARRSRPRRRRARWRAPPRRATTAEQFVDAYRRYCWPVDDVDDLALAPFQVLATEGTCVRSTRHRGTSRSLGRLAPRGPAAAAGDAHGRRRPRRRRQRQARPPRGGRSSPARGGEGMVVKPRDVVASGRRGLVQPGVKCRGREYLRIIYGPEYTDARAARRGCASAGSATSARWRCASSRSGSKPSSASSRANRSTASTSACSASSRSRASPSTPASDPGAEHLEVDRHMRTRTSRCSSGGWVQAQVDGGDGAHAAGVEVVDGLEDLLAGVHHERAVVRDRLADREAAEQQHLERVGRRPPGASAAPTVIGRRGRTPRAGGRRPAGRSSPA